MLLVLALSVLKEMALSDLGGARGAWGHTGRATLRLGCCLSGGAVCAPAPPGQASLWHLPQCGFHWDADWLL